MRRKRVGVIGYLCPWGCQLQGRVHRGWCLCLGLRRSSCVDLNKCWPQKWRVQFWQLDDRMWVFAILVVYFEVLKQIIMSVKEFATWLVSTFEGYIGALAQIKTKIFQNFLRFSWVWMDRICRLRCSPRLKHLPQPSTLHTYILLSLTFIGASIACLVGTRRPLLFFVKLGTGTGSVARERGPRRSGTHPKDTTLSRKVKGEVELNGEGFRVVDPESSREVIGDSVLCPSWLSSASIGGDGGFFVAVLNLLRGAIDFWVEDVLSSLGNRRLTILPVCERVRGRMESSTAAKAICVSRISGPSTLDIAWVQISEENMWLTLTMVSTWFFSGVLCGTLSPMSDLSREDEFMDGTWTGATSEDKGMEFKNEKRL